MNTELDPQDPRGPLGPSEAQIARMRANVHASIATEQTRTRRRGWTIGGTLSLLVLVAGGTSVAMAAGVLDGPGWFAAAPAPTLTHEPITVTTPTPTATAAPSPTPTPTPPPPIAKAVQTFGQPSPRINLGCDQLVSKTDLQLALSTNYQAWPEADMPYQSGTPWALDQLIMYNAQLVPGSLNCAWSNTGTVGSMLVTVTPKDALFSDPAMDDMQTSTVIPAPQLGSDARFIVVNGDQFASGHADQAELRMSVGDLDLDVQLLPTPPYFPADGSKTAMNMLSYFAPEFVQRLTASGPTKSAYSPPGRVDLSCQDLSRAVTAAPGTGVLRTQPKQPGDDSWSLIQAVGGVDCSLNHRLSSGADPIDVSVRYLPGGAWDHERVEKLDTGDLHLTRISNLGEEALVGCVPASTSLLPDPECWVEVFSSGAWLDVSAETTDPDRAVSITRSVLAALSSGPEQN